MIRLFLLGLSVFFVCSVAQAQETDPVCEEKGNAAAHIRFGDSKIEVDPKVNVRKGDCIEFKLSLQKAKTDEADIDYETVAIQIVAKDEKDEWLNKTFSYSESVRKRIYIPVPEDQAKGIYSYYVIIENVGKLDPRVEVID